MAQHDYNIANGSGAVVRADINSALDAIVSENSGTTAPSTTFAYMFWADTTAGILKMRNGANTTWINMQNLDGTLINVAASIASASITSAMLRNSAALSVIGNTTNASAVPADIVAANDGEVLRRSGTAIGFGTVATAGIANNAVTYAKVQQGTALSVPGVTGNATANLADIVAGTDGHVLRRSGTALAFGTVATAGIAANAVTDAVLRQSAGLSVIGRSANTTGNVADITAVTDGHVLRLSGTAIGFGTVATAGIADAAVTYAKIANAGALTVVGRSANTSGVVADIAATATSGAVLRESGSTIGFGTVATAGIAANAITNAKLAQMAVNTIKGRITAGTGDPEDLTAANVKTILALTQADISGLTTSSNPQFATIELGAASDTTLSRVSAGVIAVEGVTLASTASPTFTGTPAAPTAAAGTNTTQVATTAFVDDANRRGRGLNAQTGTTYTFVLTDAGKLITFSNAAAITVTVPPNSSVAFTAGDVLNCIQKGAGQVAFAAGAGVTIRSSGSKLKLTGQYSAGSLVYEGSDVWYYFGDIAT